MTPKLTNADKIEIEAYYDGALKQDWDEPTEHIDVSRWTNYGHDRLYINDGIAKCNKNDLYVDLQTHEVVSNNESVHPGGDVEINGETAEITILSRDSEHVITVSLEGDEFEPAEDDEMLDVEGTLGEPGTEADDDDLVADGGSEIDGEPLGPQPAEEATETEEWDGRGDVKVLRDGKGRFVSWSVVDESDDEDSESDFSTPECDCGNEKTWEDDAWKCPMCDSVRSGPSPRTMPRSTSKSRVGQSGGLRR